MLATVLDLLNALHHVSCQPYKRANITPIIEMKKQVLRH